MLPKYGEKKQKNEYGEIRTHETSENIKPLLQRHWNIWNICGI